MGRFRQVLDLGSNVGFTIRMWREMFPQARIIGVEPDPGNMLVCRMNAESIPDGNVKLIQACVDGKPGTVLLDRTESEHRFHIADEPSDMTIEVNALTVLQILERANAEEEIGLLKCDVQGAEQAIFADCKSWISRVRNLIVEVHPPYTGDMLLADLAKNGWTHTTFITHNTDALSVLFFYGGR